VHQPLRVVLDVGLRLPATSRLLAQPGPVLVVTVLPALAAGEALRDEVLLAALSAAGDARADAATRLRAAGASLLALPPGGDGRADLRAL
ncbi:hypothetical protein ABTJ06_19520, partial [Acinetobacter baumannii]